ncbi:hypothetical protein [Alicyclobacillus sp. ALC3]|uniref:hypothetical protein n=1 Tax=Alicyclobacillus sp. ALC3 TaxID=2796143 RepID=UPI00237964F1|nr:hypothetical protein [Alicyclobacillus sp. ALC3]WDL98052.1 hypothetical protein JC200_04930 [Alicyclobacillus sp. ALC3]
MGKQRKRPGALSQDFSGGDKPEYAADWFREEKPKKPAADKKVEENGQTLMQDHLGQSALAALAKLKAEMAAVAAKEEAAKAAKVAGEKVAHKVDSGRTPNSVVKNRSKFAAATQTEESEREASFAELFDPAEPDDASFEELLKKSKLDWRTFKD